MSPHSHAANKYVAGLNGDHEHFSSHRRGKRAANLRMYRKSALSIFFNFSQNPYDISNNRHDGKLTLDEIYKIAICWFCIAWRHFCPRGFPLMAASKPLILTAVAVVAVVAVVGWLAVQPASKENADFGGGAVSADKGPTFATDNIPSATSARSASPDTGASTVARDSAALMVASSIGVAPSIRADANANVASVAEASQTGKFPERLSPLVAPKPFDEVAFSTNPQAYLDVIEPGRVFQGAAPGTDVPVLYAQGPASFTIPVGGSCTLTAITAPKAPITFTTLDLGTFPNHLTTITVQANDLGEASTIYSASGGVIAGVRVLTGSPLASGQVTFRVWVTRK